MGIAALWARDMRPHFLRLLYRSLVSFTNFKGTTPWGFFSSDLVQPVLLLVFFVVLLRTSHGEDAVKIHLRKDGIIGLKAIVLLVVFYYCPIFLWKGARIVWEDHRSSVTQNGELKARLAGLQGFATEKQQLEDQVRAAKADAERWQSDYTNLSHGDIHPDRFLNNEQTNQLFVALERIAKDPRNKDYIRNLFVACDCGGEPCQLARQILKAFQEAHWQATGMSVEKLKQITSRQFMPTGLVLFSDDGNKGGFLSFILKDAGVALGPDEYFVKLPPDPKIKTVRTVIWIGAKQRWQ
jgi:hypothetical protein